MKRKNTMKTICALSVCLLLVPISGTFAQSADCEDVIVVGEGAGSRMSGRQEALLDALRRAVRQGVGEWLISEAIVMDFQLEYDRIFSAAFGYVRSYSILSEKVLSDGTFRMQVKARVCSGSPDTKDWLAMKQLLNLKGLPRVAIITDELIDGVSDPVVSIYLQRKASEIGLNLIDESATRKQSGIMAARDIFHGDELKAAYRNAGLDQKYDYIIEATARVRNLGRVESKPGGGSELSSGLVPILLGHSMDFRVLVPDRGAVLRVFQQDSGQGSSRIFGRVNQNGLVDEKAAARQFTIDRMECRDCPESITDLFRRLVVDWSLEIDLGSMIQMEFFGMEEEEYRKLLRDLRDNAKISAINEGQFDSQGMSYIEAESRLTASALAETVRQILGGTFKTDRSTRHSISFLPVQKSVLKNAQQAAAAAKASTAQIPSAEIVPTAIVSSIPASAPESKPDRIMWILGGLGIILLILGLVAVIRVTKK